MSKIIPPITNPYNLLNNFNADTAAKFNLNNLPNEKEKISWEETTHRSIDELENKLSQLLSNKLSDRSTTELSTENENGPPNGPPNGPLVDKPKHHNFIQQSENIPKIPKWIKLLCFVFENEGKILLNEMFYRADISNKNRLKRDIGKLKDKGLIILHKNKKGLIRHRIITLTHEGHTVVLNHRPIIKYHHSSSSSKNNKTSYDLRLARSIERLEAFDPSLNTDDLRKMTKITNAGKLYPGSIDQITKSYEEGNINREGIETSTRYFMHAYETKLAKLKEKFYSPMSVFVKGMKTGRGFEPIDGYASENQTNHPPELKTQFDENYFGANLGMALEEESIATKQEFMKVFDSPPCQLRTMQLENWRKQAESAKINKWLLEERSQTKGS